MAVDVSSRKGGARTVGDVVSFDTSDPFYRNRNAFDLVRERAKATFCGDVLTEMLCGGKERWNFRRNLRNEILNDPIFSNDDSIFLPREAKYKRALEKFRRLEEIRVRLQLSEEETLVLRQEASESFPLALHWLMFVPYLQACCTDEQLQQWLPKAQRLEVVGCYAQTELGHGSNVRGLETTATLLPGGGEFELHSPSLSAIKFWPGTLGRSATHALVFARLCVRDKSHGVHGFIVPIRDLDSHRLLPGVTAGDIGPKIGFNNMDNGWCRLERVRVPRAHMPMRFTHVTQHGEVTRTGLDKAGYVTMMELRGLMVFDCRDCLAKACTIAVRYSAVRRQGQVDKRTGLEPQVLSYATQRHRLLGLVSTAFALHFTGERVLQMTRELRDKVHGVLCGLKAICTRVCTDGIEECRKCCGGMGYLLASGLPELLGHALQYATAEGDNYVMAQQSSRFLLKVLQQTQGGDKSLAVGDCAYIGDAEAIEGATCQAETTAQMRDPAMLKLAFYQRSLALLARVGLRFSASLSDGLAPPAAWDHVQVDQHTAVHAHVMSTLVGNFLTAAYSKTNAHCAEWSRIAPLMQKVGQLFALSQLCASGDFLETAFLRPEQMELARGAVRELETELAGEAVGLVDAFWFSDLQLASAIGRYDGEAYLGLLEAARGSDLNRSEPVSSYAEALRPILRARL